MILGLLESFSLIVFLVYIHLMPPLLMPDWLMPYALASLAGISVSIFFIVRRYALNPIFIGINLYFISGLCGLLWHFNELNEWYGQVRAAAMLGWILLVGIICWGWAKNGFLGVPAAGRWSARQISLVLILVCCLSGLMAAYWPQNKWLGEVIPFFLLFGARNILLKFSHRQ